MNKLTGNFKRTIYYNDGNSYLIGLFKVKEASSNLDKFINKTITITGYLPDMNEIDTYILEGEVVFHEKYGEQFVVNNLERVMPKEKDSIVSVLSSDMFKGIGVKTAEAIVAMFHEDTFDVILNNPNNLLLVKGVSEKQVRILHEVLKNYQGSYEIVLNLSKLGFNTRDSLKIHSKFKADSFNLINEDIYKAYYYVDDLSFKMCDYLYLKNGNDKYDLKRLRAIFIYVLRELTNVVGFTYFNLLDIRPSFIKVLGSDCLDDDLVEVVNSLIQLELIVVKEERIYLKEYYEAEIFIARRLRLLSHEEKENSKKFAGFFKDIEKVNNIKYDQEQKEAIIEALTTKCLVITGGPGTGKTTIIKGIIDLYKVSNKLSDKDLFSNLVLLAPTGRASKRMSEVTNLSASTIHRFLKWNKEADKFLVNEYNKSKAKFVIIDEASMLDTLLLSNLLKGLSSNCRVVFVGDDNQLPSVGAGDVLHDLIKSEEINVIKLANLYRQGKDSNIITFAHDINKGVLNKELFNKGEDLTFIECPNNLVLDKIKEEVLKLQTDNYQVLAPLYKTINGIDNINLCLQDLLNKKTSLKKEIVINNLVYRENDKVIELANMPDEYVFNGDIGVIDKVKINPKKEIYINYDGNLVKYTNHMFNKFSLAYAISIHKSQGSEFNIVIMPIVKGYNKMLYRKLIYTGVTRSKEKLILIGDIKALEFAINNTSEKKRKTSLYLYLKNGIIF